MTFIFEVLSNNRVRLQDFKFYYLLYNEYDVVLKVSDEIYI